MNIPNTLTIARLVMVPVFVVLMSFDNVPCFIAAYIVFLVAALTDYYDGKIARARNLITNFGKLFDPVADKVLIVGAYVMLMKVSDLQIPAWAVVVIIAREILITAARSVAATDGVVIAANIWGKTKAVIQMVYVFTFLFLLIVARILVAVVPDNADFFSKVLGVASFWAVVFVALFTMYSGLQFAWLNWNNLKPGNSS